MKDSLFDPSNQNADLSAKIVAGLERISEAFKVLLWDHSKETGISPIQIQILIFIAFHRSELNSVSSLSEEFNLTKATVSDAVKVLEKKKLVKKNPSPTDGRAYIISLSSAGEEMVKRTMNFADPLKKVIDSLDFRQKEETYQTLTRLIHQLHILGVITVQRTCMACRFYEKKGRYAYCNFLNMELRDRDIRIDCPEYEER